MRDQLIKGMVKSTQVLPFSFANEAVYAVCIYQFSILTLMWHAYRQAQTDTDRDSNSLVVEPQEAIGRVKK